MRLAVMQPYLFPYLGYFQLMHSVDRFVLFDDVAFIKRGWINRNRILVNGAEHLFSVPVENMSQNRLICDTLIAADGQWKSGLLKTLEWNYRKAPCFGVVFPMIAEILGSEERRIARFIADGLAVLRAYLGLSAELVIASVRYANQHLKGEDRILDICRQEGACAYHNAPGGAALYDRARFASEGIALRVLEPHLPAYRHTAKPFVAGLSIIDVLMWNPQTEARSMVENYALV
jgi:hypothetical protein